MIAQDQAATGRVIGNFRRVVKDGDLRLYLVIGRLVEKDVLKSFEEMSLKQKSDQMADADGEVN